MPKLSQKSFVSGQYDRIAQNQESIDGGGIVARGLSYAKNVLSSDRGELRKRLGTKYLKTLGKASVIIPFRMPNDNDAILVVDDTHITGYNYVDGQLDDLMSLSPESAISFPAGNTWPDGTSFARNGDWTISTSMGTRPGRLLNKSIASAYPAKSAPQRITISNSSQDVCLRSIRFRFRSAGPSYYAYKYWYNPVIEYSDDGIEWLGVQTDYAITEKSPEGCVDISGLGYVCFAQCSGTVTQNNYHEGHRFWRVFFQNGGLDPALDTVMIQNVSFVNVSLEERFEKTSPYTEKQLKNIKYSQDKNIMFISCEDVVPHRLINNTGELTWGGFTPANTPTIWQTAGGYPAAVSMFQNRVWFGGFQNNPTTVIASKFDDYETFNSSSPVQKGDYLNLRCNQLKTKIRNLVGGQNIMCCFSEDGISYIDGGSTGLLATNENIEFKLKNRMPAGGSTPGFKDDVMLYSSSDGTKLYGVDFDLLVNRFEVSDLAKYAKDITKAKVTEIHYVNNESKLVYGLMEDGSMFALLYEKGQYQGFFPLEIGEQVYDIAPVKVGRDYKLLMVVFRDGEWYLEEKLDCGNYIDTSTPRLTDEEKKWATYDNLENNIALDCYQSYDESFNAEIQITDETHILSNVDLSNYVGKSIMLNNDNEKDFVIAKINSTSILYAWNTNNTLDGSTNWFTLSDRPQDGDLVYDEYGNVMEGYNVSGSYHAGTPGYIIVLEPPRFGIRPAFNAYENPNVNKYIESIEIEATRGTTTGYSKIYPEFTEFMPNLSRNADVAVISEGRYFNTTKPDENGKIYLPAPCHKVIYGVPYESVAIIKLQAPYESLKNIAQVDLSVINSTHLEVGTNFEDTQNIEKIDDSSYYDLTRITMNDTYRLVLSDTPETTKNLILRSNKGVPFTVIAVDMYVNYSNLGGD